MFVRHFYFCATSLLNSKWRTPDDRVFLEYVHQWLFRSFRPSLPDHHYYRRRRLAPPLHSTATALYSPSVTVLTMRCVFVIFFFFNGIASGKWFFSHFQTNRFESNLRLICRFFLERYLMIGPFYYIFLFLYLFYVKYGVTERSVDERLEKSCSDAIIPNTLFITNFYDSTEQVNYIN